MLTEEQQKKLENKLYKMIREAMYENGIFEKPSDDEPKHETNPEHREDSESTSDDRNDVKHVSVKKWLSTAQELHSVLAYDLWPEKDEDAARSLFSKKFRGEDADGKKYDFDDAEINKLYNMMHAFIDDIS